MRYPDYSWYELRAVGEKRRKLVPYKFVQDEIEDLGSRPTNVHISIFRFNDEIKKYSDKNDNRTAGFRGSCYADYLPIDVDIEDEADKTIESSLRATRKIISFLGTEWGLKYQDYACYFTGGRGFHFHIPIKIFGDIPPTERYPDVLYELLIELFKAGDGEIIKETNSTEERNIFTSEIVDFAPYSPLHMIRMPGTVHESSQRWKIPVRHDEIMGEDLSVAAEEIWDRSANSRPAYRPQIDEPKLEQVGDLICRRLNGSGLKYRKDYEAVGEIDMQPTMTSEDLQNINKAGFGHFAMNARKLIEVLSAGMEEGESVADLGGRNDALCFLVGKLKNRWGLPKDVTTALLHHWNQANTEPLPQREFQTVINNLYNK